MTDAVASPPAPAYVGLMSGTSLDGISAAAVRFADRDGRMDVELLAWSVRAYSAAQRERLRAAMDAGTAAEYCALGFDLGEWLAAAAQQVIAESGVPREAFRAIGSHGQTLWHEPARATWQVGEAAVIAERTGIAVVSDFRVRDVAAGGHGAPLVPIADALLFAGDDWRVLQNIGGMGNVTVVPPRGDLTGVRAFDTGPGVAVIDAVTRAEAPALEYDVDGRIAAAGSPDEGVVATLLAEPFFATEPPRSTGREAFGAAYATRLAALVRAASAAASHADVVATATLLTARSIADAYRRFMPEPVREVVISGGGARNPTLVAMLRRELAPLAVVDFADRWFDGEAKEAVAFALLAHLHVGGRAGNVARATGARGPRILGKLTPA